ncbi:MAG TPA: hypothetical protein VI336_00295 [Candidatus Saccharimonadales bacterium]|nr:hypothetical protein [Candidatus Saccharimonadales bacterium]
MEQLEMVYVTSLFAPSLDAQARIEAARRKISRSELVRLAVADYLKRLEAQTATTTPTKESAREPERQPA